MGAGPGQVRSANRFFRGCYLPFVLAMVLPTFLVLAASHSPWLGAVAFALGAVFVGYLLSGARIGAMRGRFAAPRDNVPEVPPGIRAPEGRTFAVEMSQGPLVEARVSLSLRGAPAFDLERESRGGGWRLRPGDHVKVETGDSRFDARFHLEGERIAADAREALKVLFDEFGVTRIESKEPAHGDDPALRPEHRGAVRRAPRPPRPGGRRRRADPDRREGARLHPERPRRRPRSRALLLLSRRRDRSRARPRRLRVVLDGAPRGVLGGARALSRARLPREAPRKGADHVIDRIRRRRRAARARLSGVM